MEIKHGNWVIKEIEHGRLEITNTHEDIDHHQKIILPKNSNGWFDRIDYKGGITRIHDVRIYNEIRDTEGNCLLL
jgi:hypothetical protein